MQKAYNGLTKDDVLQSKKKYGSNVITPVETETFFDKLKENIKDPIIKILIFALALNIVFFILGKGEWYESVGIAIAVCLSTFISSWSEYSNEESFQKLQDEASKISCKVFRDGQLSVIGIDDIVVGDFVMMQTGDKLPADGYILSGQLHVDQSSLTGESVEVEKLPSEKETVKNTTDLSAQYNVYRGTTVTSGEAVIEITSVGDNTIYGALAQDMKSSDRQSPLKLKLEQLALLISKVGYLFAGLIFVSFLFNKIVIHNGFDPSRIADYFSDTSNIISDVITAVILCVVIIVSAVPEGLPMMVAFVLSLNMRKMLSDNVLVRKLVGIETAGSLNLLFTDKTGTITKGILEVVVFISGDKSEYRSFEDIPDKLSNILDLSIKKNTNAVLKKTDGKVEVIGGNGTEKATLDFVSASDNDFEQVRVLDMMPFSSDRKFSASRVKLDEETTLIKGAGERIIANCSKYYDSEGNVQELKNKENIIQTMDALSAKSIRLIGVATTDIDIQDLRKKDADMTLIGMFGIRDEVRPESKIAIKEAQDAGIQVVMITGDRKETAHAIAKDAGLIQDEERDIVLTSDELNSMTDDEIKDILGYIRVIARALPTDKSRLVKIAQEQDLVVGMTGDGVNDSPALKKSDVGFAMGSGTEVAKEAGDIVILDDNFKSITKAVLYGRTIFNSIRKFIVLQISINFSALLIAFIGPFIGVELPLTMVQILWINLIMDTLAALALGGEPALERYMSEKPKNRKESIINREMASQILIGGLYTATLCIFFLKSPWINSLFRQDMRYGVPIYLMTGFFSLFIILALFNAFNARTTQLNLLDNISLNRNFILIIAGSLIVQIVMTFVGGAVLRTAALNVQEWIVVFVLAFTVIPVDLLRKIIVGKKMIINDYKGV